MEQKKVINGFIWRFLERCGAQGVTFLVSIILARILGPEYYGVIAIITVFTSILQCFVDYGLGLALVQKKDADDLDFSSVFYFNTLFCVVLYFLLFAAAPYIAAFYENDELTSLTRVLGLTIVISGVKNIQQSYVSRHMMFKKFFFSTLGGTIAAAVVGIAMAMNGFGAWALVFQHLVNTLVDTVILWFTVKWRPKRMFSWERLKCLFSYGWKLLASSLLDTIANDVRQLIIGKIYTEEDLAFYNKGKQFPNIIMTNINTAINSVLFPAMSSVQDDVSSVKRMTRQSISISTFIMAPMLVGLGVCAGPIVNVVLTDKWASCVFFMRIFCFSFALYPMHIANLNAIKAMGRSDIFLKLEIAKKVVGIIAILATMFISVEAMAYSVLATAIIGLIINAWPNKKLLNYSLGEQLKDVLPSFLMSGAMGLCVYSILWLKLSDWLTLLIQIPLGVLLYFGFAKIFRSESLSLCLKTAKAYFSKETGK